MQIVKSTYVEPFVWISESKSDIGWGSEIGVYVDPVIPTAGRICAAIVTHPCTGAKWFVHDRYTGARGVPFKTRKAALWAAIEAAKDTEAYRLHQSRKETA